MARDTRRLAFWLFLRRQCRRLMMLGLVLAAAWSVVPLLVPRAADHRALEQACRATPGCVRAHLCPAWRRADGGQDVSWRPEVDVCLEGEGGAGEVVLPPGTARQWVSPWLRPLVAPGNRARWAQAR